MKKKESGQPGRIQSFWDLWAYKSGPTHAILGQKVSYP